MSGYTKFCDYGKFNACNRTTLRGDSRIMNPFLGGKVFTNPFKIENNDMRLTPDVKSQELDYEKFKKAYPQMKL